MTASSARRALPDGALLLTAAAAVFVVDRLTKAWVAAKVDLGAQHSVVGDLVQLWHTENAGAAFGLLPGAGLLFVIVGLVTVVAIGWVHLVGRVRGVLPSLLLGVVLGGALGNLVDRLLRGTVTDFISVGIGSLRWPTFNVADAAMFTGIVGLVVLLSLLDRRAAARAA